MKKEKNQKINALIIAPNLSESVGSGISRYAYNLANNLLKIDSEIILKNINYSTNINNKKKIRNKLPIPNFIRRIIIPVFNEIYFFKKFIKNIYFSKINLKNEKADIYHAMSPNESVSAIKLNKRPVITTFHDIIPLIYKKRFLLERVYFKYYCKIAKKSDRIIVNSKCTKEDLIKFLKIPKEKIIVTYLGINTNKFYPKEKADNKIKKILYLGGLVERKGIYETLYAFNKLLKIRKDVQLLIGGGGKEDLKIKREINRIGINRYIKFLGIIKEEKLPDCYRSVDVFVYPSKYEGFGFTPLEAMACGIPVITSNCSSIPEIVGDAAIKVDPNNINEICTSINNVLNDKKLQKKMIKKGIKQVKLFSWKKCAEETLKVYKSLL